MIPEILDCGTNAGMGYGIWDISAFFSQKKRLRAQKSKKTEKTVFIIIINRSFVANRK